MKFYSKRKGARRGRGTKKSNYVKMSRGGMRL